MSSLLEHAVGEGKIEFTDNARPTVSIIGELTEVESIEFSVDNEKKEWFSINTQNWKKSIVTGKALSLKIKKQKVDNAIADNTLLDIAMGSARKSNGHGVLFTLPLSNEAEEEIAKGGTATPATVQVRGPIAFDGLLGGASTDIMGLEFTIDSYGAPVFTKEVVTPKPAPKVGK